MLENKRILKASVVFFEAHSSVTWTWQKEGVTKITSKAGGGPQVSTAFIIVIHLTWLTLNLFKLCAVNQQLERQIWREICLV